jgi:hypothetical protein
METPKIKSTYKIFGGFGLLLVLTLVFSTLYFKVIETQFENNYDLETWLNSTNDIFFVSILSLWELVFLSLFMSQNKFIIIDNEEVIFINPLLPFIRKTRKSNEYDYFITVAEQSRGGEYEAIWLIKDNKIKDRISSFYYSNYYELKDNLSIRNEGERNINPFMQIFYLFGLRIKD